MDQLANITERKKENRHNVLFNVKKRQGIVWSGTEGDSKGNRKFPTQEIPRNRPAAKEKQKQYKRRFPLLTPEPKSVGSLLGHDFFSFLIFFPFSPS